MHSITKILLELSRLISIVVFSIGIHLLFAPVVLAAFAYRGLVALLWKFLRPDLDCFVTGFDACLLAKCPEEGPINILMSSIVKGRITENRIQEMFQERVINLKDTKTGQRVYKKLSQFWVPFLGFGFWKTDESFEVSNHVRKYDYENVISPRPADENCLKQVIAQLLRCSWKPHRSHWEVLISYPFKREESEAERMGDYSLVIFRFDHALLDGLSLIKLYRVLFQSPFTIPVPVRYGKGLSLWHKVKLWLLLPYEMSKSIPILYKGRFLCERDMTKDWIYDVSTNIPVSLVKSIKEKHGVDYGAVLHSCISGTIFRVLEMLKKNPPNKIDMACSIPMARHSGGMQNTMRHFLTELPFNSSSPLDRLFLTDAHLKRCAKDLSTYASFCFSHILSIFPLVVSRKNLSIAYSLGPSYGVTIVPTITSKDFMDRAEIIDVYTQISFIVNLGLMVLVAGVNDHQRVNFLFSTNVFGTDIPKTILSKKFEEELEALANSI